MLLAHLSHGGYQMSNDIIDAIQLITIVVISLERLLVYTVRLDDDTTNVLLVATIVVTII